MGKMFEGAWLLNPFRNIYYLFGFSVSCWEKFSQSRWRFESFCFYESRSWSNWLVLRKKSPYLELFRSAFSPYFRAFGLNTERYGVSLRIQSECRKMLGKMQTRITPNTDSFYAVSNAFYKHIYTQPHAFRYFRRVQCNTWDILITLVRK